MAGVSIQGLTKQFPSKPPVTAMDDLTLDVERGEFLVLLGPSGCGKTTTLRCLAGLETPDAGRIRLGDSEVFDSGRQLNLPPDKRNIGMVFQSYALWPHMRVAKNIAYPLRARGLKRGAEREERVREMAALVDCEDLLDRYPAQLSGGQQQRIALARGLVGRPDLVLLDEPLSNLDALLRDSVRAELHELHARLRFTAVFVTHDQAEALALADRIAIMNAGRFEQVGTPEDVFERPSSEYVAAFIGMANRVLMHREGTDWVLDEDQRPATVPESTVIIRTRPSQLALSPTSAEWDRSRPFFEATVVDAQYGGQHMDIVVLVHGERMHTRVPLAAHRGWARSLQAGDNVIASLDLAGASAFGPDGKRTEVPQMLNGRAPAGTQ